MGSRLVEKWGRKYLVLCLTLFFFIIMAAENLYNTAVEYHSAWAAGPPLPPPKPSQTQTCSFTVTAQLYKHTVRDHLRLLSDAGVSASAIENSGPITAVMMESLLFCSTASLHYARCLRLWPHEVLTRWDHNRKMLWFACFVGDSSL